MEKRKAFAIIVDESNRKIVVPSKWLSKDCTCLVWPSIKDKVKLNKAIINCVNTQDNWEEFSVTRFIKFKDNYQEAIDDIKNKTDEISNASDNDHIKLKKSRASRAKKPFADFVSETSSVNANKKKRKREKSESDKSDSSENDVNDMLENLPECPSTLFVKVDEISTDSISADNLSDGDDNDPLLKSTKNEKNDIPEKKIKVSESKVSKKIVPSNTNHESIEDKSSKNKSKSETVKSVTSQTNSIPKANSISDDTSSVKSSIANDDDCIDLLLKSTENEKTNVPEETIKMSAKKISTKFIPINTNSESTDDKSSKNKSKSETAKSVTSQINNIPNIPKAKILDNIQSDNENVSVENRIIMLNGVMSTILTKINVVLQNQKIIKQEIEQLKKHRLSDTSKLPASVDTSIISTMSNYFPIDNTNKKMETIETKLKNKTFFNNLACQCGLTR